MTVSTRAQIFVGGRLQNHDPVVLAWDEYLPPSTEVGFEHERTACDDFRTAAPRFGRSATWSLNRGSPALERLAHQARSRGEPWAIPTLLHLATRHLLQRDYGVQCVVVGSIGAIIHGANTATFDFDVAPATSPENLDALAKALVSLGAKLRIEDGGTVAIPIDRFSLGQFELSTWRTDAGDIDIIRGNPAANGLAELRFYSELAAAGERVEVFGATVVVASLATIIESKEGAGRAVDDQALPPLFDDDPRLPVELEPAANESATCAQTDAEEMAELLGGSVQTHTSQAAAKAPG